MIMRKKNSIALLLICLSAFQIKAQQLTPQDYINLYKYDAVEDMLRTGVPASITLAQGVLESESGNSDLARIANNHFGIKCHKEWSGDTFHKDDDEKHECFRKYNTVLESFDDHSNFLKTRPRYTTLFTLEITDYKGWAKGLKKAGYATNPHYAHKLIDLIERYNLNELDQLKSSAGLTPSLQIKNSTIASSESVKSSVGVPEKAEVKNLEKPNPVNDTQRTTSTIKIKQPHYFAEKNNVKYVIAKKGDTWMSIADKNEMMLWQVLKYNDAGRDDFLPEGTIVYIKPKRANATEAFHVVKDGETMRDISQLYAVKLFQLYKKNQMEPGTPLTPGMRIILSDSGN